MGRTRGVDSDETASPKPASGERGGGGEQLALVASSGDLLRQGGTLDIRLHIPGFGVLRGSSQKPEWRCFGGFLALAEEGFSDLVIRLAGDPTSLEETVESDSERGERGGIPAREGEPRREEQTEQQAPAPQGPERADMWWASLLRTRFEDGAIDIAWDEFVRLFQTKFVPEHIQDRMEQEFLSLTQGSKTVLKYEARFATLSKYAPYIVADEHRKAKKFVMGLKPSLRMRLVAFDHRTLDEALSAACRQEGEMEQYLEEKKALQKRPAAPFQRQDKKKAAYQTPQRPVAASSTQVPSQHSLGVKKECPHCGKTHGGMECWMVAGKCLKCGSSDHKIKDCPRL
ncbi:hypothetical protein Taro_004952 [Colocasia esculenta]|uniref:CCHC-type domain-containing protein n=1 Tax=Colocasia esculenta TaxID=4460 RepID=A0A843TT50_COLES|nr:hypothetical protein [Colocasia esculenta]